MGKNWESKSVTKQQKRAIVAMRRQVKNLGVNESTKALIKAKSGR